MAQKTVTLVQEWEDIDYTPKAASTAMLTNQFLKYDGTGGVIPATGGDTVEIMGVGLELVSTTDSDYTSTRKIAYQRVNEPFTFKIPIGTGTAAATMVGSIFNLTDAGSLDVSGAGKQILVTNFISTTLVEGRVILMPI